jgi:hypothetical protein
MGNQASLCYIKYCLLKSKPDHATGHKEKSWTASCINSKIGVIGKICLHTYPPTQPYTGILTLPGYQAWGFLIQRLTLKLTILTALLKPNTRSIEPSIEPNLDNPSGSISKSVLEYLSRVWVCPTLLYRRSARTSLNSLFLLV